MLHLTTGGLVEVKAWVLQFGREAEVLAPQSLREECLAEMKDMLQLYEGKESCS